MTDDPWGDSGMRGVTPRKGRGNSLLVKAGAALALTVFVGVVVWGAYALLGDSKPAKRRVVQIALLAPPPPPPPPPPPQVKPPEPEVKEEVKAPEPEPPQQAEAAPPPGEQLGLDAEGGGSGDSFGLVAKKGGQDITTIGGGGNDRARFSWFAGRVETELAEHLQKNDTLRKLGYRVVIRIWFSTDGRIERYELVGSTGDPEIDRSLKVALDEMPRLKENPPADMPQPVKLRITARASG